MTDFYVYRHGDTVESGSIIRKILGHHGDSHNLPILQEGKPALEKIGKYLKEIRTDVNFCSPYLRCVVSSGIVEKVSGKKYKEDQRLRELEKNGEKFGSFYNRVKDFLNEIHKKNYSSVSICTHGAVIAAIKHFETSGRFYFFQVLDFPSPGNLLIIKNGKVEDLDFNSK